MSRRVVLGLVGLVVVAAVVVGILVAGGGDDGEPGGSDEVATASLTPATERVEAGSDPGALEEVRFPRAVRQGDVVSTDAQGSGELEYPDGSLSRLGNDTVVTVVALEDPEQGTRLGLEVGRVWERVKRVTGSDKKEVETPVALASVRGTAYAIECDAVPTCTFTVAEGMVVVTPERGNAVRLRFGQRVTVDEDGAGEVEQLLASQLGEDPWVAGNAARDGIASVVTTTTTIPGAAPSTSPSTPTSAGSPTASAGTGGAGGGGGAPTASLAQADPSGTWDVTTTVTSVSGVQGVTPGSTGAFTYRLSRACAGVGCELELVIEETATQLTLVFDGSRYVGSGTFSSDCLRDDGAVLVAGGITNDVQMVIRPTRVSGRDLVAFDGTIAIAGNPSGAAQAAGCGPASQANDLVGAR